MAAPERVWLCVSSCCRASRRAGPLAKATCGAYWAAWPEPTRTCRNCRCAANGRAAARAADAARAVTAAAAFLAQAKRVVFVGVAERSENTAAAIDNVARQFAWCGIPAEVQVITPNGRSVQESLATAAQGCASDLVVSGAYGHSHLREVVFGGCTQSFIRHFDRPVLLMH
jgi:nucleotide-binding universal stress UspA family protein